MRRPSFSGWGLAGVVLVVFAASCSGANQGGRSGSTSVLETATEARRSAIEVHALAERPRLTVVRREGDPAPAVAIAVATDLGPGPTAALSALVEARLVASGFAVHVHVDRSGFRVEWTVSDAARLPVFFAAIARAMRDPFVSTGPELALITRRLAALRKAPLDAPELGLVSACTGQPGVSPNERLVDPASAAFARDLERQRGEVLHAGRTAIAAVGPSSFADLVDAALESTEGFPIGEAASDPFPAADVVSTYIAPPSGAVGSRLGRITVAVRLGDALSAVGLAERLAAPGSALRARLSALPEAFRLTEVIGVARPRGGCVSVSLSPDVAVPEGSLEVVAARAAAVVQHELRLGQVLPSSPEVATRQILSAADPRDAAARAAWWDLSVSVPNAAPRFVTLLGSPARRGFSGADASTSRAFVSEVQRAVAQTMEPVLERKATVERGQGELWMLVASPCGVAYEGVFDAGTTALGLVAAVASRDLRSGVVVEPWVGAEGLGILAHSSARDERETPMELASRVGDAAARVLAAGDLSETALSEARASLLSHLGRVSGQGGLVFDSLSLAMVPEHPSWMDPFGSFVRVSGATLSQARLRLRDLLGGPLRLSVIANADVEQAAEVGRAVERYLVPRVLARPCPTFMAGNSKPGQLGVRLPRESSLGQTLVSASVPRVGVSGHELALFSALALSGAGGILDVTFPAGSGVLSSARVVGTGYAAALVIDIRAPDDLMVGALADVRAIFQRLANTGLSQAEIARASRIALERDEEARLLPRRRLISLWTGRPSPLRETPTAQSLSTFLATTFQPTQLYVIEGLPER